MKPLRMTALASAILIACSACTYARYTNPEHSLIVIDLHPTGNTVNLDAALTGKGKLSLNRESGSAEGIVDTVTSAVTPSPLD